jgi:hypothetical protein
MEPCRVSHIGWVDHVGLVGSVTLGETHGQSAGGPCKICHSESLLWGICWLKIKAFNLASMLVKQIAVFDWIIDGR